MSWYWIAGLRNFDSARSSNLCTTGGRRFETYLQCPLRQPQQLEHLQQQGSPQCSNILNSNSSTHTNTEKRNEKIRSWKRRVAKTTCSKTWGELSSSVLFIGIERRRKRGDAQDVPSTNPETLILSTQIHAHAVNTHVKHSPIIKQTKSALLKGVDSAQTVTRKSKCTQPQSPTDLFPDSYLELYSSPIWSPMCCIISYLVGIQ
jgi:hypothetical protein